MFCVVIKLFHENAADWWKGVAFETQNMPFQR